MTGREEELQAALDAWTDWCRLKRRSDQTMAFIDCHDTAQAGVRFQNLYLGDNDKLAVVLPFRGSRLREANLNEAEEETASDQVRELLTSGDN